MWKIIKAEYKFTFTAELENWQWLMPFLIMVGATLYGNLSSHSEMWLIVLLIMAIGLTLHEDNRIYIFSKLPLPRKSIAFARLLMLTINVSVVLLISSLLFYIGLVQPFKSNIAFINLFGVAVVIRLITFCLSDITFGYSSVLKRVGLVLGFTIIFIIPFVLPFTIMAFISNKYGIQNIAIIIIPIATLILSYISIKTFTAKEITKVREE